MEAENGQCVDVQITEIVGLSCVLDIGMLLLHQVSTEFEFEVGITRVHLNCIIAKMSVQCCKMWAECELDVCGY